MNLEFELPIPCEGVFVEWRHKPVKWNTNLEKLWYDSVCILYSLDDWDSMSDNWHETSPEYRNRLRSIWYTGYITGGASKGNY